MFWNSAIEFQCIIAIMQTIITLKAAIPPELNNKRLDQALSHLIPEHSRSRLQEWIKQGFVKVDGKLWRAKDKVQTGANIEINATIETATESTPQDIPIEVVYEDEDLIVINKPAGLVIHPGAGQKDRTLLNALLHSYPELQQLPRAGIVHRLDKETSGLLVVARTLEAHSKLVKALATHQVKREYVAIVNGVMTAGGTIDAPIGRHKTKRTHMAVIASGKPAITHYRVIQKFPAHTLVQLNLETGRTHQIRVHLAHINYPIVGDPVYGGRLKIPAHATPALQKALKNFKRQALHARKLGLKHPRTGKFMEWEAPLPGDIRNLLAELQAS